MIDRNVKWVGSEPELSFTWGQKVVARGQEVGSIFSCSCKNFSRHIITDGRMNKVSNHAGSYSHFLSLGSLVG